MSFILEKPNNKSSTIQHISKSLVLDDFWDDCQIFLNNSNNNNINENKKTLNKTSNKKSNNIKYSSSITTKTPNKNSTNNILNNKIKKIKINSMLSKLFENNPSLYEDYKREEIEKYKRKNAEQRCLSLYAFALVQQKYLKDLRKGQQINNEKNELEKCTWKPKINKLTKIQKLKFNSLGKNIYLRDKNRSLIKLRQKSLEKSYEIDNYKKLFLNNNIKAKINKEKSEEKKKINNYKIKNLNNKFKTMFDNNKSLYTDRNTSEFILRYTKARDEHMIRRFKKLSNKDDSYDNSYYEISMRNYDPDYKNLLNVNSNLELYGQNVLNNNLNLNNINYYNNYNQKDIDYNDYNKNKLYYKNKEKENNIIVSLRKKLNTINFNDSFGD
jgi:hypothetical protein